MAGNRHHVIPKFLLKGFTSRIKSNQFYTNVYLGNKTYESNIINVGVDKDFYVKKINLILILLSQAQMIQLQILKISMQKSFQ